VNTGGLTYSPSGPVVFPTQLIDTSSGERTVTLTNTGATAISIRSVVVAGNFRSSNTCGGVVAPGARCDVNAAFEPRRPGPLTGTITLDDTASPKPQVIDLSGLCTPLQVSSTEISFGDQKVGTTSPPKELMVTNKGRAAVTFNGFNIGFGNYLDFSVAGQTCGTQLSAGSSCAVQITFSPTNSGSRYSYLQVNIVGGGKPTAGRADWHRDQIERVDKARWEATGFLPDG